MFSALRQLAERTVSSRSSTGRSRIGSTAGDFGDRKSTRLNSSHLVISYAVFCLKKKKKKNKEQEVRFKTAGGRCIKIAIITERARHLKHGQDASPTVLLDSATMHVAFIEAVRTD